MVLEKTESNQGRGNRACPYLCCTQQLGGRDGETRCNLCAGIDKQTVENQIRELRRIADRRGWEVVEEYRDAGISGAKGRDNRPGLNQMLKDASKRRFDVVMAWAIDRLGRSLIDLLGTIQTLEACRVDLYLDQQAIDTTTPAGRLMFQVTGAFAEFERSVIRQRVRAGLKRALEQGKQLGRPKIGPTLEKRIQSQLRAGKDILKVAREIDRRPINDQRSLALDGDRCDPRASENKAGR